MKNLQLAAIYPISKWIEVVRYDIFILFLFQHAVLWSCEKHNDDNYWHQGNMDRCLVDTMKYTEGALRAGRLPNYFNTRENILKGKNRDVLNTLADHFKQERMKLTHL